MKKQPNPYEKLLRNNACKLPDEGPKQNLKTLVEFLEKLPPKHFNMQTWRCGTSACIGGWVSCLWGLDKPAGRVIGLNDKKAHELFFVFVPIIGTGNNPSNKRRAIATLKYLMDNKKLPSKSWVCKQ